MNIQDLAQSHTKTQQRVIKLEQDLETLRKRMDNLRDIYEDLGKVAAKNNQFIVQYKSRIRELEDCLPTKTQKSSIWDKIVGKI